MDNRIFNVNGRLEDEDVLLMALTLALKQEWGHDNSKIVGWSFDKEKGMVLHKYDNKNEGYNPFPTPLTASELLPIVISFLYSDKAKEVVCEDWDKNLNHDGDNGEGWRLYSEDWGMIEDDWTAYMAIKPAYMWYGK